MRGRYHFVCLMRLSRCTDCVTHLFSQRRLHATEVISPPPNVPLQLAVRAWKNLRHNQSGIVWWYSITPPQFIILFPNSAVLTASHSYQRN